MKIPEKLLDEFDQQCAAVVQADGKLLPGIAEFLLPENHERASRHRQSLLEILREYQGIIDGSVHPDSSGTDDCSQSASAFPELPGYEFTQVLGQGRSVVFEAVQQSTGRLVAIKTITAFALSPLHAERLRSEARILASLRHPHIVTVYHLEQYQQALFLVMQHVSGENLSTQITREPVEVRRAVEIIQTVAQAIQTAHESGVLHRDLKPSNILIDHDGWIYVTDFDLSRQTDLSASADRLTATGEILGTPEYLSPEQAAGASRDISAAADVYGLGATFYHLLTGRPPFVGGTMQVLDQVQNAEPVAPKLLRPDLPRDVQTICLRCLRKNPQSRFDSAAEFSDDLQRYLDGRPIVSRPTGVLARTIRWCKRRPAMAALIATTLSLLILSLLLLADRNRQQATLLQQTRSSLDRAYDTRIRSALLEYENNNLSEFARILSELQADSQGIEPAWEWQWLSSLTNAELWKQQPGKFPTEWIGAVAFSPNGKFLAVGTSTPLFDDRKRGTKAQLQILDAHTGELIADLGETMSLKDLRFSPDGTRLYELEADLGLDPVTRSFDGPAVFRCWNVADWQELHKPLDVGMAMHSYVTADMKHLLITGAPTPDGAKEAVPEFDLRAIDISDSARTSVARDKWTSEHFSDWSIDSKEAAVVAISAGSTKRFLLDDSSLLRQSLRGQNSKLMLTRNYQITMQKQPNSSDMLVNFRRRSDGSLAHVVTTGEVECLAVSADEKVIAIATNRGEIQLLNLHTWEEFNVLRGASNIIHCMQFGPNGRMLATGDWDGHVRVWDTTANSLYTDTLTSKRGNRVEAFFIRPTSLNKKESAAGPGNSSETGDTLVALVTTTHPNGQHTELQITAAEPNSIRIDAKAISAPGRLAAFSNDRHWLFTTSEGSANRIDVRNATTGEVMAHLPPSVGNIGLIQCSGDYLLTAAWPDKVDASPDRGTTQLRVFRNCTAANAQKQEPVFSSSLPACRCYRMALSPDRRHLSAARLNFTADGRGTALVQTWELATGQLIDEFETASWVLALSYHPDGRLFALDFDEGDLTIRSPASGQTLQAFPGHCIHQQDLAFSPDGRRLAGTTRGMVTLWNSVTLRQVLQLPLRTFASDYVFNPQVRFSTDGTTLFAIQPDGTVRRWQY